MPESSDKTPSIIPNNWERAMLEKVAMASILEQRAARRWKTTMRMAWLAFFVGLAWLMFHRATPQSTVSIEPHTAVVEISGAISDGNDSDAQTVISNAKTAFENNNSKAVVLLINSPGGSPVQSGIINDELLRMKAKYKKPLYAVVGDSCASGAYYVAVAADQIFVDKASMVGSIGVLMDGFGFTGTMEKLGIERRLLTSGDNKGMLDPFSPLSPEHKAHAQTMLAQIHQQFIDVVRKNRSDRLKENPDTFSGMVWTGQQAIQMGLADQLGSINSVARDVVKQEKIVDYTKRENVAEKLVKKFGVSVGVGMVQAAKTQSSAMQ